MTAEIVNENESLKEDIQIHDSCANKTIISVENEALNINIKKPASQKTKLNKLENIPRGKPKSGRPWKETKQKFSNIKKSIYRRPFHKKVEFRKEIQHIKQLSKSIKEAKKEENKVKKQRRLENAERRLKNQKKSEIVQIIKNPNKLKRMKRKHLRMIEKRDIDSVKVA